MAKTKGNVASAPKKRGDEGKAKPSQGSNKVGDKWGFIPAPAGGTPKHHPMSHSDGKDDSGAKDSGKGQKHGHHYGVHPSDKRKTDNLSK